LEITKNLRFQFSIFKKETFDFKETQESNRLLQKKEMEYKYEKLENTNNLLIKDNYDLRKNIEILKEIKSKLIFEAEILKNNFQCLDTTLNFSTQYFDENFLSVEMISIPIQTQYAQFILFLF